MTLVMIVLGGCKSCEKENQCPEVSADFTMMETDNTIFCNNPNDYWTCYFADTICSGSVMFEAKDLTCDIYEWKIGLKTYYGKKVEVGGFYKAIENGVRSTNIQLKVKKLNKNQCFSKEDTIVRISNRNMYMVPSSSSPLFGYHFGYFDNNPKDTFTVKYWTNRWYSLNDNEWVNSTRINAFNRYICIDSNLYGNRGFVKYRQARIGMMNNCNWQNLHEVIANISVLDGTFRIRGRKRKGTIWTDFTFTETKRLK